LVLGEEAFTVCLRDGRRITVPYHCYPNLDRASMPQRSHFEVYAEGKMLGWPDIDEDIEVQHIVDGRMPVKAALAVAEEREPYGGTPPRRRKAGRNV